MANFKDKGDVLTLRVAARDAHIIVGISGTYDQTIKFQREQGSLGSGSWLTLATFRKANASEVFDYYTRSADESLRLILATDNGGEAAVTLTVAE